MLFERHKLQTSKQENILLIIYTTIYHYVLLSTCTIPYTITIHIMMKPKLLLKNYTFISDI